MGKDSKIGWTHHTFNPWWGCEKPLVQIGGATVVSPECVHCYAETWDKRCGGAHWGHTAPRRFFGPKHWCEPLKWNAAAKAAGERHRVFCLSMGDILEDRRDLYELRAGVWELIRDTPDLDWLLLTKRADRFDTVPDAAWELSNVWPGVTAGTQEMADLRIPPLLRLKARFPHLVAWVSVEPMLGAVSLDRPGPWNTWLSPCGYYCDHDEYGGGHRPERSRIDWVVIGGESGAKARPFDVAAGRALLEQCQSAGVPVFWKQFGARPFLRNGNPSFGGGLDQVKFRDRAGADPSEWPKWARCQEFPEVKHG